MAKLHFKYAAMNSGKTIDLIRTAYNYEENGFKVLIIKPKLDKKGEDKIVSRIGLERKVDYLVKENDSVIELLKGKLKEINCILCDEAQFFTSSQVEELALITKAVNIPVLCYGLKTSFTTNSFDGSKRLFELADELEPLYTLCSCKEIARFNARKVNGEFTNIGDEVVIDGINKEVEYVPLCGKCYMEKVLKLDLNKYKRKLK